MGTSHPNRSAPQVFRNGTLLSFHLNVGLIDPPAPIGGFQIPPAALVQLRPVSRHRPPHSTGANGQTSLPGHLRHLCHRDWVTEIPAHTPRDNVSWKVSEELLDVRAPHGWVIKARSK